jgi:lysozyme family protein
MTNQIDLAYANAFERCVAYTERISLLDKDVNKDTMKRNIETARDYYQKVENKGNVSLLAVRVLNNLERRFNMGVTR